jgi:hypothetical protein
MASRCCLGRDPLKKRGIAAQDWQRHDIFNFAQGDDVDRIHDFRDGNDLIDISDFGFTSTADFTITSVSSHGSFVDFGGGDGTYVNVKTSLLTDADFIFN